MNTTNATNARLDDVGDIIELGVASIETRGPGGIVETFGDDPLPGLSDQ